MTVCEHKSQAKLANPDYMEFWRDPSNYHPHLPVFKRSLELYVNDSRFRSSYDNDPKQTLVNYGLGQISPLDLDILTDIDKANEYRDGGLKEVPILVKQYRQFIHAKKQHCAEVRGSQPDHLSWRKWRERMVKATLWREGPLKYSRLVHAPFTIEFTHGCTVGCWFCGVSAEKFQGPVVMSDDVKLNWRHLLTAFNDICGQKSAQHGFCYWATDPLDHPEYEWFLEQFHDILGYWPQTTTAQAMKHADRVRKLFTHINSKNAFVQRFSLPRSTDLKEVMDFFTPEELFMCELIPQYDNDLAPKATAGRVRDLVLRKKKENKTIPFRYDLDATGSIACVSGFLINLVERSIKIITPCPASDRWPLGYRILGQHIFSYEENIEHVLKKMLNRFINNRLMPDDLLKSHYGVVFSSSPDCVLSASSHGYTFSVKDLSFAPLMAKLLQDGTHSVEQVCSTIESEGGSRLQVLVTLHQLFDQGIFDEDVIDRGRLNLNAIRGNS